VTPGRKGKTSGSRGLHKEGTPQRQTQGGGGGGNLKKQAENFKNGGKTKTKVYLPGGAYYDKTSKGGFGNTRTCEKGTIQIKRFSKGILNGDAVSIPKKNQKKKEKGKGFTKSRWETT